MKTSTFLLVATVTAIGCTESQGVNEASKGHSYGAIQSTMPLKTDELKDVREIEKIGARVEVRKADFGERGSKQYRGKTIQIFYDSEYVHSVKCTGPQFCDQILTKVSGFKKLQSLSLANAKITDAGLVKLYGLSNLKNLDLTGTSVTDAGVRRLKERLPKCKVIR